MRVLIVDDSVVYRSRIRAALNNLSGVEVVGVAGNGKVALEMITQKSVDLITLDMEMPVMSGLETLRELRKSDRKTKVIMFSASTRRGSEATLDALASGADDFVAKPATDSPSALAPEELIRRELAPKVLQFLSRLDRSRAVEAPAPLTTTEVRPTFVRKELSVFLPSVIVIASSTGGPAALDEIFRGCHGELRCPILIAQHMPPVFTAALAKRLSDQSGLKCREGVNGERLANEVYVAPGDYHLTVALQGDAVITTLNQGPPRNSVRPAADNLFESAASVFGMKCMGFVLTGMGEDGKVGAVAIKKSGGGIAIQDQASSVVFGMPGAVFQTGAFDDIGDLKKIQGLLGKMALA